jgi:hypothetical protein
MGDTLLNGRPAEDFEAAAIRHGRRCELERDAEVVAGLTAGDAPRPETAAGRPVTGLADLAVLP